MIGAAGYAIGARRSGGSASHGVATGASSTTGPAGSSTAPPPPLRLVAVQLVGGPGAEVGSAPITLRFSAPLARSTPPPRLSPATSGTWVSAGDRLTFTPASGYLPLTTVDLVVPAGSTGILAADGGRLHLAAHERFRVAQGSTLRLNQLLSLLAYSPLGWTAERPVASNDAAGQLAAVFRPPPGRFSWLQSGWPSQLTALWHPARFGVMTRGLVMSFQADHELAPDGDVTTGLWRSLLSALAGNVLNTGGYNYALGNKAVPESLTIWHDGTVAAHVPANTGIASSPTPDGNFPVYTRLRNQVMHGTNPDGETYADPVQYVAYFHDSDAVHYIARANYGIPQSLGCIELSLSDAALVWPYLAYGTIVSVIN